MPFTPTTPEAGEIPQPPVAQDKDELHATVIVIRTAPGNTQPKVTVDWVEGYDNAGEFVPMESKTATFQATPGSNLETIMNAAPDGASLYAAIKNGVYKLLQDEGEIPAGAVS